MSKCEDSLLPNEPVDREISGWLSLAFARGSAMPNKNVQVTSDSRTETIASTTEIKAHGPDQDFPGLRDFLDSRNRPLPPVSV